jgi:hypothetical protein
MKKLIGILLVDPSRHLPCRASRQRPDTSSIGVACLAFRRIPGTINETIHAYIKERP